MPGGVCTHDINAPWQGTQWNKVEHLLFCHITQTWRGKPLTSRLTVVDLIAATTTTTGLKVHCELDPRSYPKGIKVTDDEMSSLNITGDKFHPEWNYTIAPEFLPEAVIVARRLTPHAELATGPFSEVRGGASR